MAQFFEVRDLAIAFGGVKALDRVSFATDAGQVLAIIGPNGAGKTTVFNCISGLYRCSGSVQLDGRSIHNLAPHQRAGLGIARTFQTPALLEDATVLHNVMLGRTRSLSGFAASALGLRRPRWSAPGRASKLWRCWRKLVVGGRRPASQRAPARLA